MREVKVCSHGALTLCYSTSSVDMSSHGEPSCEWPTKVKVKELYGAGLLDNKY